MTKFDENRQIINLTKIVKFNTLKFLLLLQLAICNLFSNLLLYLKDLFNKEIDYLSKIIETTLNKNRKKVWSVASYPLKR